ncbi:MAG: XRE family transcriptional regulator [Oscillospiraceae bacterium]|nr:XRE family transcriptional regulator [Oscillospiraceae bacterium]
MKHPEFTETFNRMYQAQGRSKAEIARLSGTSEAYLYQIFSGARVPSRDRLLCICIGMCAEADDTQTLLSQCGYAPLYVRDQRDAIILHGLMHATPLGKVNDMLFEYGEKLLFS